MHLRLTQFLERLFRIFINFCHIFIEPLQFFSLFRSFQSEVLGDRINITHDVGYIAYVISSLVNNIWHEVALSLYRQILLLKFVLLLIVVRNIFFFFLDSGPVRHVLIGLELLVAVVLHGQHRSFSLFNCHVGMQFLLFTNLSPDVLKLFN